MCLQLVYYYYKCCYRITIFIILAVLSILILNFAKVLSQITIDMDGKLITWEGCIYRRTNIFPNKDDPCYKCSESTNMPIIPQSITDWPQPYFNCTEFCEHRTICTSEQYYNGIDDIPRSLCYNCENMKNEEIVFEFIRDDEICSVECSACAATRDMLQASICAKECFGHPTFCFPLRRWYGKSFKCFRATYWYGCDYFEVPKSTLSTDCSNCAMAATNRAEAQECAFACKGVPTYHIHPKNDMIGNSTNTKILQCRPHVIDAEKNGWGSYFMEDLFLYDIPKQLVPFLRFSTPISIYPPEYLSKEFIPGPVAKNIWKKFTMAVLTFPKPKSYVASSK